LAWLHSAPKRNNKDENPKSRLNTLPKEHPSRKLPEVDSYLSKCFELSGFCLSGSMGAIPLTWSEVDSFSALSGYPLNGWQSEHLVKMSRDYCYMLSKAKTLSYPSPYSEFSETDEDEKQKMRDRVAKQWDSFSENVKVK
jgi:hypothetical protein